MKLKKTGAGRNNPRGNDVAKPAGKNSFSGDTRLRNWGIGLLVVLLGAAGTFALFEFVILSKIPPELVGRWRVVGGQMEGAIFDFHRNGAMTVSMHRDGKEWRMDGTAEVSGKTIRTTTEHPITKEEQTGRQTIITLTETEFVTQDANGTEVRMQRLP